jgi:O-antigen ligase
MGLIGLGFVLPVMGVFFAYAWRAWRRMERDSDLEPILLGVAGALLGVMVGGLVDHYFFNLDFPHSVSLFWLYAALTVVTIRMGEEARAPARDDGAGEEVVRQALPL